MKTRILFVDDEPLLLSGLQSMFHSMRDIWEVNVFDKGEKALEAMRQNPYDVVVSDMRMPGMNGIELLGHIMKEYPQAIRLILSGYADHDLVMKSMGTAHRFMVKPCSPDDLKSAILRATTLKTSFPNETVFRLVSGMEKIPSLPTLYLKVVEKMASPNSSLSEIAKLVSEDIGMTSNILKLVNSAYFGHNRQINDTTEAVAFLGLDLVSGLVLAIDFFSQYQGGGFRDNSMESLWQHSLEVATLAKALVIIEGGSRMLCESAFLAGILHDVGKLVLSFNFPDTYADVLQHHQDSGRDLLRLEDEFMQANHAEVGSYLMGLWGLDEPVVEAIALHHAPILSSNSKFSLLTAIHAADVIVNESSLFLPWGGSLVFDQQYLENLGLEHRLSEWMEEVKTFR